MTGQGFISWPWVCVSCHRRYAAFRVYARTGWDRLEWTVCADCGPLVPGWQEPPRAGWADVYHTVLRPVPAAFDPVTNPYPHAAPVAGDGTATAIIEVGICPNCYGEESETVLQ